MGVINFAGTLPVALVLQWKGECIPNAITDAKKDFRYVIANESVSEFEITATVSGTPTHIRRTASPGKRFFDDRLNTYTTSPVSGSALDDLIAAGSAATCTIDLTFTYRTFFDVLLEQMTRTDADLHNLANPNDSDAILDTFGHSVGGGEVSITYKAKTEELHALPCKLVDYEVTPRPGKSPAVKLVFELDFTPVDPIRREAMRKLIAMDWSKLVRYGQPKNETVPFVAMWVNNVRAYLVNNTDEPRSVRIYEAVLNRHLGKTAQVLSSDLRDDIDLHIVTANHWGQAREDMKTERHQRLLSDLFGTLHQTAWLASPVSHLRAVDAEFLLGDETYAGLVLQYGVGHCGEHACVSFELLTDLIVDAGTKITTAVRGGNANVDHAFVVYELDVDTVLRTITTNPGNGRTLGAGKRLRVWNLRDAIGKTTRTGFVMDPYLDTSVMKSTAVELLAALNKPRRTASGLDTDFLAFERQFPQTATEQDISALPEADRRRLVKNV